MMSGHGANPIFCNKKIKIGRPEHLLPPTPLRPVTSHFCLTSKVDVICVSSLSQNIKPQNSTWRDITYVQKFPRTMSVLMKALSHKSVLLILTVSIVS